MQLEGKGLPGDVRSAIRGIYELAAKIEALYLGRPFTPDGPMVGSIGEVIAAQEYDLSVVTGGEGVSWHWGFTF